MRQHTPEVETDYDNNEIRLHQKSRGVIGNDLFAKVENKNVSRTGQPIPVLPGQTE